MKKIQIHFKNQKPIVIQLDDSDTSKLFLNLLRDNLNREGPIWRDPLRYDLAYFKQLCGEIKDHLGWEWDMENFLEKEESFSKVPGQYQNLIHEAHYCIHTIEYRDAKMPRGAFLQLEWFNDDFAPLPEDKVFKDRPGFGEVLLQNPYVGHPPIQCWQNNDFKNIVRTCAYHDRIKPGIKINLSESRGVLDVVKYKRWWLTNCQEFVRKEGMDKIMRYTGYPVIGEVVDKEHLQSIIAVQDLQLNRVEII